MQKILYIAKKLCLSQEDINNIEEFLEHNEYGIAFEELCSAIEQENISLNHAQYEEIVSIGKLMKMDSWLWKNITIYPEITLK